MLAELVDTERKWQIGDVIARADGGENMCIGFTKRECIWLTDRGNLYYANLYNQYQYARTEKLSYKFPGEDEVTKDFKSGLFKNNFSL